MTVAAGRLEVETPDHIVLRYDLAGAGNRGFAAVLDFAVASLIVFAALMLLSLVASETGDVLYILGGVEVIVTLVLIWSYFILLEWLWLGPTERARVAAVIAAKLRPYTVEDQALNDIDLIHAIARSLRATAETRR